MEKKVNKTQNKIINKRESKIRKKMVIKLIIAALMLGIILLAAVVKKNPVDRYTLKADYLKGETEYLNKGNTEVIEDGIIEENTEDGILEEATAGENTEEITEYAAKENTEEKTTEEDAVKEKTEESKTESMAKRNAYKRLNVECVLQNPELPTGCEITALTIILNYLGYDVSKTTMADNYLDKGEVGKTSPYKAFVGNPRDENSCGAFAPVIVKSARNYLNSMGSDRNVYNVTGADYDELTEYVDLGHPVLVWETMWMAKPHEAAVWEVDGESITWKSHEHAMVLIGYTDDTYIMADPLRGIYEYDKETVEARYEEMGKQAIVIY